MNRNFVNSIFLNILVNNLNNNNKIKCNKLLYKSWKCLKINKIKPNILFFLIICKIKPLFMVQKKKRKKKKKKFDITYIPKTLSLFKGYKIAIKWFLIPLNLQKRKNYKFNFLIQNCFYLFIDKKKKNISLIQKKNTYLKFLKYKKNFRI